MTSLTIAHSTAVSGAPTARGPWERWGPCSRRAHAVNGETEAPSSPEGHAQAHTADSSPGRTPGDALFPLSPSPGPSLLACTMGTMEPPQGHEDTGTWLVAWGQHAVRGGTASRGLATLPDELRWLPPPIALEVTPLALSNGTCTPRPPASSCRAPPCSHTGHVAAALTRLLTPSPLPGPSATRGVVATFTRNFLWAGHRAPQQPHAETTAVIPFPDTAWKHRGTKVRGTYTAQQQGARL